MNGEIRRRDFVAAALAAPFRFKDGRDWFFEKRFGMFVHWGIYAIPAWHEQDLYRKKLKRADYTPLAAKFNPVKYDPEAWLDLARDAGMEYVCFTTKHIDGFCMWDTAETRFNIMNTPYRRDTLKMLADACHRRGVPLCLYYSVVDENHPNYPNRGRPHELPGPEPGDQPDEEKYMAFLRAQVRELCTKYGEIHGFWWDAQRLGRKDPAVNQMIRSLQPKAVINNRGFDGGDFSTPERDYDDSVNTRQYFDRPVEACESVGYQSWGYRVDEDYYSDAYLMRNIQKILAKGGNYLLNIGPKADGSMPEEGAAIFRRIGKWYRAVKESLVGVEPAGEMSSNRNVLLTRRGETVYVHLVKEPDTSSVFLHPMARMPRRATILHTGAPVECDVEALPRLHNLQPNRGLRIKNLPVNRDTMAGWVIKLEFS
jgi:alpha-L-fucosidase